MTDNEIMLTINNKFIYDIKILKLMMVDNNMEVWGEGERTKMGEAQSSSKMSTSKYYIIVLNCIPALNVCK